MLYFDYNLYSFMFSFLSVPCIGRTGSLPVRATTAKGKHNTIFKNY